MKNEIKLGVEGVGARRRIEPACTGEGEMNEEKKVFVESVKGR